MLIMAISLGFNGVYNNEKVSFKADHIWISSLMTSTNNTRIIIVKAVVLLSFHVAEAEAFRITLYINPCLHVFLLCP